MNRLRGSPKKGTSADPLVQSSSTPLLCPTTWSTTLVANGHGTLWHHPHDHDEKDSPKSTTIASIHLDDDNEEEEEDTEVRICFRNHTLRNLLLCWVGHDGTFHHYYTLSPFSPPPPTKQGNKRPEAEEDPIMVIHDDDHIETSTVGHAFVVLATTGTTTTNEEHDQLLLQIQQQESIAPFVSRVRIVGAYRSNRRPIQNGDDDDDDDDDDEVIHLVEVTDPTLDRDNRSEFLQHPVRPTRPFFRSSVWRQQLQTRLVGCCCGVGRHPKIKKYKDENDKGRSDGDDKEEDIEEEIEEAVPLSTTVTLTNTVPHDSTRYILTARLVRQSRDADDVWDTSQKYYQRQYFGKCRWPVMVEPKWYGNDRTLETLLAHDLDGMVACLPEHAVTLLRDTSPTPIYINRTLQYGRKRRPVTGRGMCFHPGSEWLQRNGMSVEKCESVEMYRAGEYREMRQYWGRGGILVHEFSHAFHHKGCIDGYDNEEIMECYQKAMSEGIYDAVPVHGPQGPVAPAYAKTNAMEYFAELSTAFLGGIPEVFQNDDDDDNKNDMETGTKHRRKHVRKGRKTTNVVRANHHNREEYNKWYPHNRQQLLEHDPRAYELLKKMWKIP